MGKESMRISTDHRDTGKVELKLKMLKALLMMILCVQSTFATYTPFANYNFFGLSAGTTSIASTITPGFYQSWTFESKS